jgi:hypothetical protein
MGFEVSHGHFSTQQKSHRPGEEPQQDQQTAEAFQYSGGPQQGKEVGAGSMSYASEKSEQLLKTMQRVGKPGHDAQQ